MSQFKGLHFLGFYVRDKDTLQANLITSRHDRVTHKRSPWTKGTEGPLCRRKSSTNLGPVAQEFILGHHVYRPGVKGCPVSSVQPSLLTRQVLSCSPIRVLLCACQASSSYCLKCFQVLMSESISVCLRQQVYIIPVSQESPGPGV